MVDVAAYTELGARQQLPAEMAGSRDWHTQSADSTGRLGQGQSVHNATNSG